MWCIVWCDPDVGGALAVITGHGVGIAHVRRRDGGDVRELDLSAGTVAYRPDFAIA